MCLPHYRYSTFSSTSWSFPVQNSIKNSPLHLDLSQRISMLARRLGERPRKLDLSL